MTSPVGRRRVVVIDTDVWSHLYLPRRTHPLASAWRRGLLGATVVIATQTKAELLFGFAISGWEYTRRTEATVKVISTATIPVDDRVVAAWVKLHAECKAVGHALQDKVHTGDRWVAATAIALDAELLAGDHIYRGGPGLRLIATDPGTSPG